MSVKTIHDYLKLLFVVVIYVLLYSIITIIYIAI